MILVDVEVPAVDKIFDFQLDENVYVSDITEEIAEMIAAARQSTFQRNDSTMLLCSYENRRILSGNMTLAECGVRTGSRLLFV